MLAVDLGYAEWLSVWWSSTLGGCELISGAIILSQFHGESSQWQSVVFCYLRHRWAQCCGGAEGKEGAIVSWVKGKGTE